MGDAQWIVWAVLGLMLLAMISAIATFYFQLIRPWQRGFLSGAPISVFEIIGMRMRNTPVDLILDTHITFVQRGTPVSVTQIERCYLARRGRILDCHDLIRLVEEEQKQTGAA